MFGEMKNYIGFQVNQTLKFIYVNQSKYVREILKTCGIDESKLVGTPIVIGVKFSK